MYDRPRHARTILVLLLVASIAVITLDFRERRGGPIDQARRIVLAVFGPLERGVSVVLRPVGDVAGGLAGFGRTRAENRRLRADLDRLRAEERTYQDLLSENEQLRGALGMARRCGCRTVGATVVARSGSNYQWSVTIDGGRRQGIAPDMAVIDAEGVVGRVDAVSADYATVLLLADPSSGVAVSLARTKAPAVLKGGGDGDFELEPLAAGTDVRVGDPVVTQGYQGGVFPSGLPVGVVDRIGPLREGLLRQVWVRPYVDFAALDVVSVVVAKPVPPAPPVLPGHPHATGS